VIPLIWSSTLAIAQSSFQQHSAISVEGTVRNSLGDPIAGASVLIEEKGRSTPVVTITKADGTFVLLVPHAGVFTVKAQKTGWRDAVRDGLVLSAIEKKQVNLVLETMGVFSAAPPISSQSSPSYPEAMEFKDKPNFTVAGITDWTAAGGHGADTNLRTSEALAKETLVLKSADSEKNSSGTAEARVMSIETKESESKLRAALIESPGSFETNYQLGEFYFRSERYREAIPLLEAAYKINPGSQANTYDLALAYKANGDIARAREQVRKMLAHDDKAEFHHFLGDIEEQSGDPLAAVREYEQAARLDPSEQNYFAWGTELLIHRAVRPAVEVFTKGAGLHPKSARMLAGLGAALYASGSYDEAARRLCDASDLTPADPGPYLFLGKMEKTAPTPLPCVEQKLAKFVRDQPGNALAHYYYAMSLWKRERGSQNPAGLQQAQASLERAVTLDPKLGEAYVQLGILYFEQGNFEQAIGTYNKAIEATPDLEEAHYRLALAYKRIGEQAKAQQEFRLSEQIEKTEAATIERQRRELRQFLVVLKDQPTAPN